MWAEQAARHLAIFYDCHLDEKRALLSLQRHRLSASRIGGGWNEQTRHAEIRHVKTAEIETRPSGSGPQ